MKNNSDIVKHRSHLFGVFRACELTAADAGNILHWMLRQEKYNSLKFVVSELKHRKMALLDKSKVIYRYHSDGTWVGPFRPISRIAKRGRKGLRKALRILNVYGVFMAPEAVKEDYLTEAKRLSVMEPEKENLSIGNIPSDVKRIKSISDWDAYFPVNNTKVPFQKGSVPMCFTTYQDHIRSLDCFPGLVCSHYGLFRDLVGDSLPEASHFEKLSENKENVIGRASILNKDGGLKQRLIANVFPLLQLALSRLHNTLYNVLKHLPNCHVFDQKGGIVWAHQQLREGRRLSSIDLTKATDNIPLGPQLQLASTLFPELIEEVQLFGRAARSIFNTPFKGTNIQWCRGHPMGLKASFPLFTLFLYSIIGKETKTFAIVGDDLVVDTEATERILARLAYYEIEVNQFKSLFGSTLGEFCGQLVDRYGPLEVYKATLQKSKQDPLGLVRQYGKRAFRYIYKDTKVVSVKRLQLLYEVSNLSDDFWRQVLPVLSDSQVVRLKGRRRIAHKGGIPPKLLDGIVESCTNKEGARTYLTDPAKGVTFDIRLSSLLGYGSDDMKPSILVKRWSVLENPGFAVNTMNRMIAEKNAYAFETVTSEFLDSIAKLYNIKEAPDIDSILEYKGGNLQKVLYKQKLKEQLPLLHLEKIYKIYRSACYKAALAAQPF